MLAAAEAIVAAENPWRYQAHPEVWVLVLSLVGLYVYMIRKVGPTVVGPGRQVVSRKQVVCFVAGILMLWLASDWPVHDVGEQYLYSWHMFQHMTLTYFMPPLMLLATPEWFFRILIGRARTYSVLRFFTRPVTAGVIFNAMVMITHIPGVVNASTENGFLHYGLHVALVVASLCMWMPVIGPFHELRIGTGGAMIYLFLQSVVPTVPAGWLTFAEGVVYKHYDITTRVWGLSATHDQQIAGAIMKLGGGMFLWVIVIVMFFKRFAARFAQDNTYVRSRQMPTAEITGHDGDGLTYDQVSRAFETVPPAPER